MKASCGWLWLQNAHESKLVEYKEHKAAVAQKRSASYAELDPLQSTDKKPRVDTNKKQLSLFDVRQKKADKDDVDERVIRYIVKEMLPLRTVEKESFCELLQSTVMCRKTLSVRLDERSCALLTWLVWILPSVYI